MTLRTLYQSLLHSDMGRLRIIARQWNLSPFTVRHTDLAAELVNTMVDEQAVSTILANLPVEYRFALDALLRRDGMMPWSSFIRRWGPMREIGMGKMEREELWKEPSSAAEALWLLGLVQRDFSDHPSDPIEMAYIPEELRLYIPQPPPLAISLPQAIPIATEKMKASVNDSLVEGLVTWWVSLQKRTGMGKEKKKTDRHQINYPVPVSFLETLSIEQGWVRKTETQEVRLVPASILAWLQSDLWMQWSSVARAWLISNHWRDVDYIPSLLPDPVFSWSPNVVETRQAVLDSLSLYTPDVWYSVSDFVTFIKMHATDFMRPDGNYERWAPRDVNNDQPLRGFEFWELVEGAYIRFLITGPLAWLGIVKLQDAESDHSGMNYFYLTAAGGSLLGICEPPQFKEPPSIAMEFSGVISVPVRRRYERYQLSRIAQLVNDDNVYQFRVTPSSIRRAKQQRIPCSRVIDFLEQATAHQVPIHIKEAIQGMYEGNEGASLENHWLLRLPDLDYHAIPDLENLIYEQLTPRIVLIRKKDVNRVLTVLSEHGILTDIEAF